MANSPLQRAQRRCRPVTGRRVPEDARDARRYYVIAEAGAGGPGLMTGLLTQHHAVARATELVDGGYERVLLRDAATREDLTFDPPWRASDPNRKH